ncbi:hypothetical protein SBD_6651 [Streptomyces bottropensis ATCC 25435]|uniref:Metallophosphoesterase n=1 Tax=Streptomyces bottropensis ATCC 25435 TaxID=1054862 RepID=M3FJB2_9ACTN|nr:hypothetical protein SBD_6651 [Streptomyces bottropensis ATCC 25435]
MSVPARPATTTTPRSEGVTAVRRDAGVTVPEGERTVVRVGGVRVGGAGTRGFGGGFAGRGGSEFGEPEMKAFVRGTRGLADGLRRALDALARYGCAVRIALTRFSPVPDTLVGAPLEIHPFLGSGPPAGAVDGSGADLAVHGHAHLETEHGITSGGMRVRDVAQPVVRRAFAVNRQPVHPDRTTSQEGPNGRCPGRGTTESKPVGAAHTATGVEG